MNEIDFWMGFFNIITISSLFSVIGGLVYLALKTGWLPVLPEFDWRSGLARFAFSVSSGVVTWLFTNTVFDHGIHDASVSGIATAAILGGVTKIMEG